MCTKPLSSTKLQQELVTHLATLAGDGKWRELFDAADQATNRSDVSLIWDDIQFYRGMAALEVGEWEIGAFSWRWCAQQDGIAPEEAVRRLNNGIICLLRMGSFDEAEKALFDEIGDWPEGDFSPVFNEFRKLNYQCCFHKPEEERQASLLEIPPGREGELVLAHEWGRGLLDLSDRSISAVIHRTRISEFIVLFELCQNPALERRFYSVMMERVARSIQRDREYYRCKYSIPIFTLDEALWVQRRINRLARVCFTRQQRGEVDELQAGSYAAIPRLA